MARRRCDGEFLCCPWRRSVRRRIPESVDHMRRGFPVRPGPAACSVRGWPSTRGAPTRSPRRRRRGSGSTCPAGSTRTWISPLTPAAGGMATFIWFGWLGGAGLPDEYRGPLALGCSRDGRRRPGAGARVRDPRVRGRGRLPGAAPARDGARRGRRQPGRPARGWSCPRSPAAAARGAGHGSVAAGARLRELAALQVALHRIPLAGCPLPADGALVDRWLEDKREQIEGPGDSRANALLARHCAPAPTSSATRCRSCATATSTRSTS